MELGIYTFAELTPDPATGRTISAARAAARPDRGDRARRPGRPRRLRRRRAPPARLRRVGARPSCSPPRPRARERIRLTSAVSVLSSDDPVRVFQDFATLDLLSGGRAEIMAGRGSFIESFPLFGYDLDDYDELFAEKLELLLALRERERVTWPGRHRAPIDGLGVYPRPAAGAAADLDRGRRHAAVGGPRRHARPAAWRSRSSAACRSASRRSPSSTAGAARAGRARPAAAAEHQLARVRRRHARRQAADDAFPSLQGDDGPHRPRARLAADDPRRSSTPRATLRGANFVGSPQEVVEKILFQHEIFGHERFLDPVQRRHAAARRASCARSSCSAPRSRPIVRRELERPRTPAASAAA